MPARTYRVIHWVTGRVGSIALRHFADNPVFDLVGAFVANPGKVGRDAGDIVDVGPTGVLATSNVDDILALDAGCVLYTPMYAEVDVICQLLHSGKNVVTTGGIFTGHRTSRRTARRLPRLAGKVVSASRPKEFTPDSPVTSYRSHCAAS